LTAGEIKVVAAESNQSTDRSELDLGQIVEQLSNEILVDPSIDVESLIEKHPAFSGQLRDMLPVMRAMADVGISLSGSETAGSSAPAPAQPAPRELGDFRIIREIGRGGMGVVYEAEQILLGRRVALKILPFAAVLDDKQIQRFKNEARAAATLDHPGIVPVHSVGCERGVHYYAMQFIEGQSLAEVVEGIRNSDGQGQRAESGEQKAKGEGAPSDYEFRIPNSEFQIDTARDALSTQRESDAPAFFRRVTEIGVQVAEALEHAHARGVVHRDIKPGNLLLDFKGRVWITDFGLARIETDAAITATGDLLGTLRYMCPERALGKHQIVDERADVYSLGATLYELMTLRPVFAARDRQELLDQIAHQEPTSPRRLNRAVPAELETIVLKAIEKRPEDRYASAQLLADDLQRLLDNKPIHARRPTTLERATKWSRRHKPLVRFAVTLLLLMTIGLAASTFFIAREKGRTSAALATAESEREHAQAMSREARRAVDEMYSEVAQRWLRDQPHMTAVQEEFLRKALSFYQRFAAQGNGDPAVLAKTAEAHKRIGDIQNRLGQYAQAEVAYRQAIAIIEQLQAEGELRIELAEALRGLGLAQHKLSDSAAAEKSFRRAISLRDELALADSEDLAYPRFSNEVRGLLGAALADANRDEVAEVELRKATAGAEQLADEHPDVDYLRGDLSRSLASLAEFVSPRDGAAEAEKLYRRAIALAEEMTQAHGQYRQYRFMLAGYCHNLALGLRKQERHDETAALLTRAVELAAQLTRDFPDVPAYGNVNAAALNELALSHLHAGNADEAAMALRQSHDILEKLVERLPEVAEYRTTLANVLTNQADQLRAAQDYTAAQKAYQDAVEILETLVVDDQGGADTRRLLAHNLAMLAWCYCGGPDAKDDDPPQALRLAERAIALHAKQQREDPWARQVLGMALCRSGDWTGGLRELDTSMKHDRGGDGWQWIIVSLAHANLGHADEAQQWYERAVAWAKENPNRNKNKAFLRYQKEAEAAQ
jgi:serine/threonine protein kinase